MLKSRFVAVIALTAVGTALLVPTTAAASEVVSTTVTVSEVENNKCVEEAYDPEVVDETPAPFLTLPYDKHDGKPGKLAVTQGWVTSEDEEEFVGGAGKHSALDFEFLDDPNQGYGVPVLAGAAGCAYFSYQHINGTYTDPEGETHLVGWGAGLFVEIIHDNGMVSQYAHLDKVAANIPYIPPTPGAGEGEWRPSGILTSTASLKPQGVWLEQGTYLGDGGDSGFLLDERDAFDVTTGTVAPRDREQIPNWEKLTSGINRAQLHMAVYGGRNAAGTRLFTIDPLGIYGQDIDDYNIKPGKKFHTGPDNVFLTCGKDQLVWAA